MKKKTAISIGLILLASLVSIYFYPQMPEQMASHWNASGEVNGWLPKSWALFLCPAMMAGLLLLFLFIPKIDPLKKNIQKFRGHFDSFITIFVGFMLYIHIVMVAANLGYDFNMNTMMLPALSALFFYCGVLMQHAKRNWFIGIKTPWTLSSDRVWDKTHAIGGRLFKAYALLILLAVLGGQYLAKYLVWIILVPMLLIAFGLVVYSYLEYQKEKKGK